MASPGPIVGRTLGHYRIVEQIGAGGMGVVYRAHDERLERDVALKVLPPGTLADDSARKRFRKEGLALSRLNHPNIATVHDFDTQEGIDFLVTELVPGLTLDKKLAAGPLPENAVLQIGLQLADGLGAAHREGVVHRDLKPGNLRLTPEGRLKILDFGLAKRVDPADQATVTQSFAEQRGPAGTLAYMAPEQLKGEKVDTRADLWAAGVVLYELATGQRPFRGKTATAVADEIFHTSPPMPPKVSSGLTHIILKCLEKDPEKRYQSAKELAVDLRRLSTPGVTTVPKRKALSRPRPIVIAGAVIALVAIAVGLVLGLNVGGWRGRLLRGTAIGRIESVAVLPLQNLSGDAGQDYFADGMTEELTADLAQLTSLRVISRSSMMLYKGAKKSLPQIARELNVDAIVEGSVQRAGDRVRITAQLIYAPTDRHLWARTYERDLHDILSLQDEVAQAIVREVGGQLNPQRQIQLDVPRRVKPEAYEAYLRGSSYLDNGDLQKAIDYFNHAIKLDPDYAPPYAGSADAYYMLGFYNILPPNVAFAKMRDAALRALEKDEKLSDGHDALALVRLHYDWDWEGAEKEFKRALELNPNDANSRHDYAHFLLAMGRTEESVAESNRAVELDPLDTVLTACLCWHRYSAHQYPESVAQALKAIQREPNLDWTHIILGWDYEQQSKFDDAIAEFQKALKLSGASSGGDELALAALGHALAAAGKRQQAEDVLAELRKRTQQGGYVSAFDVAVIYTGLGDKNKAFEWLQKAVEERSSFLIYSRWEPRLDPLRSDPRFPILLRRIGLPT